MGIIAQIRRDSLEIVSIVLKLPARGIFQKLLPGEHHTRPEYVGSAGAEAFGLRGEAIFFAEGFRLTAATTNSIAYIHFANCT